LDIPGGASNPHRPRRHRARHQLRLNLDPMGGGALAETVGFGLEHAVLHHGDA
jgi:hypothetical protein